MTKRDTNPDRQEQEKPPKRFTSYEDFLKEFYPKSKEAESQQTPGEDGDFGVELAIRSLNQHANVLRFGRHS